MDQKQKIRLLLLHQMASVPRSDSVAMLENSQLNYLQALKRAFNIVKHYDGYHFIIFIDALSSLHALNINNCDHPFIQDI